MVTEWLRNGYGNPSGREGARRARGGREGGAGGDTRKARWGREGGARRASGRLEKKSEMQILLQKRHWRSKNNEGFQLELENERGGYVI